MSVTGPLLVVAGEASGDQHAARLLGELRRRFPDLEAFGLGGDELQAAGLESVAHSREISVVGITEVLKILGRAREIFAQLLEECDRRHPRAALLVDFPDFNLRLARELHRRGVPVIYYVSPQIWAWRRGRVEQIARHVARMLVLFPFEVDFYRQHGVEVVHVGHPLVDEVPALESAWDRDPPSPEAPLRLALLPGSRNSEVEALLPAMLDAVERVSRDRATEARLILAPSVDQERIEALIGDSTVPLELVERDRFAAIADSHLALCASGTATLEVGLLGTPMIVTYRVGGLTYLLGRLLIRVPHIALVNLVLEERVVPEMVQGSANGRDLAAAALDLLDDPERLARMRQRLGTVRDRLGEGGASSRAAAEVAAFLEGETRVGEAS